MDSLVMCFSGFAAKCGVQCWIFAYLDYTQLLRLACRPIRKELIVSSSRAVR